MILTVIEKFAEHEVGEVITDADEVLALLESEFARFVVRTAPKNPVPQPSAKSAALPED